MVIITTADKFGITPIPGNHFVPSLSSFHLVRITNLNLIWTIMPFQSLRRSLTVLSEGMFWSWLLCRCLGRSLYMIGHYYYSWGKFHIAAIPGSNFVPNLSSFHLIKITNLNQISKIFSFRTWTTNLTFPWEGSFKKCITHNPWNNFVHNLSSSHVVKITFLTQVWNIMPFLDLRINLTFLWEGNFWCRLLSRSPWTSFYMSGNHS